MSAVFRVFRKPIEVKVENTVIDSCYCLCVPSQLPPITSRKIMSWVRQLQALGGELQQGIAV